MSETIELLEPAVDKDEITSAHDVDFYKGKFKEREDGSRYLIGIDIDYLKMIQVFYLLGFRRLDVDDTSIFVRITNSRVVKRISITVVIDAFFDFLDEKDEWLTHDNTFHLDMLKNKFLKSPGSYFKEDKLYRLKPEKPILFNVDTQHAKYVYYLNGFVKIDKNGHSFNDYSQLEAHIWESEILKRNYIPNPGILSPFEGFITKVCTATGADNATVQNRVNCLKKIIGYYLHSYTKGELVALLLTDSKISEENEANGRTGKSLFCKSLGYMLSNDPEDPAIKTYVDINGKDFDPKEKHKYQLVSLETKVICINDLRRWFDVDCIYNDITEGVNVERKNMTPFKVKLKILLTTNKTVKIEGDSSTARFLEFEFSDFFSKRHTPIDEFKHRFFRDWSVEQWAAYDWFMFSCIEDYFKNDCKLEEPQHINLSMRKLKDTTRQEFLDYMSDLNIVFDQYYNKKDLYTNFCKRYEDFGRDPKFTQAKFSGWVKLYTQYMPEFETYNKERDEKRSNDIIEMRFTKVKSDKKDVII